MRRGSIELVVLQGEDRVRRYLLAEDRIILGRAFGPGQPPGQLLFDDSTVSRQHARLDWDPARKRYVISHLSTTNPTLVNGRAISQPSPVEPGDQVRLGNLLFELRVGIGQHVDATVDQVDVAQLIRSAAKAANPVPARQKAPAPPPAPPPAAPPAASSNRPIHMHGMPERLRPAVVAEAEPDSPPEQREREEQVALNPSTRKISLPAQEPHQPPEFPSVTPVGPHVRLSRHEKCPCGSGRKFKDCCLLGGPAQESPH